MIPVRNAFHVIGGMRHPGLIGGCAKCKALRQQLELSPTRSLLDTMFETLLREFGKSVFELLLKESLLTHPEVREALDTMSKVTLDVARCSKFAPDPPKRPAREPWPGDSICKKCLGPYWCHLLLGKT